MRLPKHSTVVSYLALFVALSGTAYAATGGTFVLGHANYANQSTALKNTGSGPALKLGTAKGSTPALSVSNGTRIANLNADEVDGLHASAFQGKVARLYGNTSSASAGAHAVGAAGPWTFSLTCAGGGPATLTIHGPGTVAGTTSIAAGNAPAATYVGGAGPIGSGANSVVGTGAQMSQTLFLQSGSKTVEVHAVMTAANGGLFEICTLVGDAITVS